MQHWRIIVQFDAKTGAREWVSGDVRYERPGWGEQVFLHPISRVLFPLPNGKVLMLSGYEAYNFNAEGVQLIGSDRLLPQAIHFYGKHPYSDAVSRWTLTRNAIEGSTVPYGKEYFGTPISGWKHGVVGGRVISQLVEISDVSHKAATFALPDEMHGMR